MKFDNINIETTDGVSIITINHPPVNTWNLVTMEEFSKAIDHVEKDSETRVVILTGAGEKCFSAGFDVNDADKKEKIADLGAATWKRIHQFPKPVIAAINGFALGGGFELALCSTFRIMAEGPKITVGLTELNLGIMPGWGGTQILKELLGKTKALDMILFSKRLNAQEALDMGLITSKTTPENLMVETMQLARALVKRPPLAVRGVLEAMSTNDYEGLEKGWEVEGQGLRRAGRSKDSLEGFTAFLEKREPVFKGE